MIATRLGENKRPRYGYWDVFPLAEKLKKVTAKIDRVVFDLKDGRQQIEYEECIMPWQKD